MLRCRFVSRWSLSILLGAAVLLVPRGAAAQSPNCTAAVPNDAYSDSSAINSCLSGGGTVILEDSGVYIIDATLVLSVDGTTLRGQSCCTNWPILRAHPDLFEPILEAPDTADNYTLMYIELDGNLDNRTYADQCEGYRDFGTNARIKGSGFHLDWVTSINAMCGSSMEVEGSGFEIENSVFSKNGLGIGETYYSDEPWSDGLTLLTCDGGWVHDNNMWDNTDIGLVVGNGEECTIEYNYITQTDKHAFAGFHVGYFNSGDQSGSVYSNNQIGSYEDMMAFGLMVGMHPWNPSLTVVDAGSVVENEIDGAVINLAIDGISDGLVDDNTTSNAQGTVGFNGCANSYAGEEYTAAHYGSATIQSGSIAIYFHGSCYD